MKADERDFCPHYQKAIELVGRRWSGTILRALLDRPLRFSEISARVPDISDRALSARLKELERESVLLRSVQPTRPVTVSYELTPKGRDLESAIAALEKWAHDWIATAETADEAATSQIA